MPGRTVIIVDDDHTRRQLEVRDDIEDTCPIHERTFHLQHFLREGAECVLANRFKRYQAW